MRRIALVPAVVVAAGACATRSDLRVLQNDLAIMRAESAHSDSAHRAQLDRVAASVTALNDSVRTANTRVYRFQGDVQQTLYSIGQQLLAIQELTGQTQRRMQEFRAQVEQQSAAAATVPAPSPGPAGPATPPTRPDSAPAGGPPAPGPNQLYQLSLDQLRRGSAGAARAGFEDLVRRYPTSDVAPDAQFYIAESYAAERNMTAADSAYAAVAQRYPESPRAPTALFKYGLSLQRAGRLAQARQTFDTIVQKYPRSDEAELARDRLRSLR